nr:unnamed protein product [Callosobruchus analis]
MVLMELVAKYKSIVENKKTNSITWKEKKAAWIKIATEFNSITPGGALRDKESLKKFYENKKREVHKVVAEEKRERRKTGGGAYIQKHENNPCYGMVIDTANSKTIYGLDNA